VYTGIFTRNGTELYRSQMVAGYVQAITGMRRGPNGFGLERNTRYTDHPGGVEQALSNLKAGRLLNGWQLRQTLEACATYECALDRLSTVPYASTEYTILSGVRKGAILSRSPEYVAYKQTLGIPADTQPASYIIMTNFDFFYHDIREWFDPTGGEMFRPRRLVAQGLLNLFEGALVVGRDQNCARFRILQRGELRQWRGSAVVVDQNLLKERGIGPTGSNRREVFLGDLDGLGHAVLGVAENFCNHERLLRLVGLETKSSW
jgi:hypothetical protein